MDFWSHVLLVEGLLGDFDTALRVMGGYCFMACRLGALLETLFYLERERNTLLISALWERSSLGFTV